MQIPFTQGLDAQAPPVIESSQCAPVQPSAHAQWKVVEPFIAILMQEPPFIHGDEKHGSLSHFLPVKPIWDGMGELIQSNTNTFLSS